MATSDYKNFLQSIFFRGQGAQTFDTVVSVGGVDYTSTSITYEVNHYSGGALLVTAIGGSVVSVTGTGSTRIFDSSGNSIIATNTMPTWTEQALIVRPILPTAGTASLTSITSSASVSVLIAATDGTRKGTLIVNDSIQTFFLKYGLTASTTSYSVRMPSLSYWEMPVPIWQGRLDGIWDVSNTGAARVTILS